MVGEGPTDLVYVPGWISDIEVMWEDPSLARLLGHLASFSRLILFDKRGTGLSDPVSLNDLPTLETAARSIGRALEPLDISVRAGLHTGEIELIGDDIAGLAVHIGAQVASLAGPGEVFLSRTVKDLVAGSGLEFESRGVHVLKGVPDEWHVFAVV